MQNKKLCVYCSSSTAVEDKYFSNIEMLAQYMIKYNYDLLYGGANIGLMGAVAKKVKQMGGKVYSVIPKAINSKGISYEEADQIIITDNMQQRKQKFAELADAFIVMPGGFGTLDELAEIITLKQLSYHNKAIVINNYDNFYDNLLKQFDVYYDNKFTKKTYKNLYMVSTDYLEIFDYLENYSPKALDNKWF